MADAGLLDLGAPYALMPLDCRVVCYACNLKNESLFLYCKLLFSFFCRREHTQFFESFKFPMQVPTSMTPFPVPKEKVFTAWHDLHDSLESH